MSDFAKPFYSPALRMKAGELEGVRLLTPDVADRILPRFIVPPSGERDRATPLLMDLDRMPQISSQMAVAWRRRPVLIDPAYIIDEFGRDEAAKWLPRMFERARKNEVSAIPTIHMNDIDYCSGAYRASIDRHAPTKLGILVPSGEMVGSEFLRGMEKVLNALRVSPSDCVAIADFGGTEFSEPGIVAPIIGGALELLEDVGRWQQIIFQGSHYPETNPAPENGVVLWPRNEWRAWRQAVKFDPSTAENMIFGDYAADCSKIEFGDGGGRAIRHVRYATPEHWRIERGSNSGKQPVSMHHVYTKLVGSGDFSGSDFSEADAYIAHAAGNPDAPHGAAMNWRQLNTTHHLTQVVTDIARVRGIEIRRVPMESTQMSLLPLE